MRTLIAKTPLVRFRRPLVFTISLLSLIIVGSTFLATRQTSKEALGTQTQDSAGVPVKMAAVTQERLPLQITVIGTAEAYSSASVNSDVDGQLTELHLTEGQYVPDQTVESRPVVVAETVGDKTILTSGLEPGEIIVTDAGVPLRSGSRVNASGNDE